MNDWKDLEVDSTNEEELSEIKRAYKNQKHKPSET